MNALPRAAAWSIPTLVSGVCLAGLLALWAGCSSPRPAQEHDADAPVTAANSCSMRNERCNMRDDDCDGIIDEEADSSCAVAHGAATCVRGACVIERCSNGYFNCNGVNADGCEARRPCDECQADPASCPAADAGAASPMDASVIASMSQQTGTASGPGPSSSVPDASAGAPQAPPGQAAGGQADQADQAGQAGDGQSMRMARPGHAGAGGSSANEPDADGGAPGDAGLTGASHADAGPGCEAERCDGKDNDCDQKVDEEGACRCAESAPTGQGEACDRCVCDACPEELDNCTGTADDEWNMLCGNVLRCFGKNVQAGLCTGSDSDCFQNGSGPCAAEFRSAFARGFTCTSDPVRTPCGGLTRLRLECYRTKCAAVCKS